MILPLSKRNILRLIFLSTGILFLVLSYLCFIYIIPGFEICGSACEYWWSWIIDFPQQKVCIMICVSRNELYKPFMIIGGISINYEIFLEIFNIIIKEMIRNERQF